MEKKSLVYLLRGAFLGLCLLLGNSLRAEEQPEARRVQVLGEVHRTLGSARAEKRQGTGIGIGFLHDLKDSNFKLGGRYVYVDEHRDSIPPGSRTAFTQLTFVMDYFVWPSVLGGTYLGGEVGVTDEQADDFFSVFSDYLFVAKVGYELPVDQRWSIHAEIRRATRTDEVITFTRKAEFYLSEFSVGARFAL